MARDLRSFTILALALWHDLNQKQIGAGAGMTSKRVSRILSHGEIDDEMYERLLAG